MRKEIVAGQFYALKKEDLNKQLESCFKHALGAGMPKIPLPKSNIKGIISPHAGYEYSGMCASHVYKEIAGNFPDTFIILGPNHTGRGTALFSLSLETFETPLGIIKNDQELGQALIEAGSQYGLQQDEMAHKFEHSIEVQLPFLQFIAKMMKKEFSIVPLVISTMDYDACAKVAGIIADVLKNPENPRHVCIIASSDMTHYGMSYGFLPFPQDNAKRNLHDLDRKSINQIIKLDSKSFYDEATKTTICGAAPIVVCLETCKQLGAKKARLLKYYTSGDVTKDYANAVGYAGIAIE
jgi:AmmeMemoRadiSam system protein B